LGARVARTVRVFPDLARATSSLALHLLRSAERAVRARGTFSWVVSGGSTPQPLYRLLATRYRSSFPWGGTEVFFADERCVPPGDARSNFGAVQESLFGEVAIARRQVHRLRGELRPASEAARRYARVLGPPDPDGSVPRFDVVLLGLGPDGHTASLFPGSPALRERRRAVVAVPRAGQPPFVPRLTLTLPALASSREVCFLVAGAEKADAVAGTFGSGTLGSDRFPASRVRSAGPVRWFLDRAAASETNLARA